MTGELICAVLMLFRRTRAGFIMVPKSVLLRVGLAVLFFGSGSGLAADVQADGGMARYRVFSLKHISAERGKQYLGQMEVGTVSQLPGANMLLVTAQPRDLIKASAIIKVVDAKQPYVIEAIGTAASIEEYPSHEQIAGQLGDFVIGSFLDPPLGAGKTKAIIDIHNGELIAIAPAAELERITSVVSRSRGATAPEPILPAELASSSEPNLPSDEPNEPLDEPSLLAEPNQQDSAKLAAEEIEPASLAQAGAADANTSELNDLFGKLLSTLDEAEKQAAKQVGEAEAPPIETDHISEGGLIPVEEAKTEPGQPSEPNQITTVPDTTSPKIVAPIQEPQVPSEPAAAIEEPGGQPKQADLSGIMRRLEALEAGAVEAAPAAEPEPVAEAAPAAQPTPAEEAPSEVTQPEVIEPAATVRYGPKEIPNGDQVLKLQLPEKMPLVDFLSFVGENLGLDYLYSPEQVKGDVTFRLHGKLRGELRVKDLYPLLESVMQFHGFAMTRKGNLVTVRPMIEAGAIDPRLIGPEADGVEVGDVVVTRVFKLEHIDTANAQSLLTNMKLGLAIQPIPETGTLIVTGFAYRMPRIEELLKLIDKPGKEREFRFRQLKYTTAQTLATKVKSLVEQMGEISVTVAQPTAPAAAAAAKPPARPDPRSRTRRPTPTPKPAAPTPAQAAQPGVYLDFDERTNRVLMIGLTSDLDMVDQLIDTLDVEQQDLRALRVYEIQNVDAEEVRGKLQELGIVGAAPVTTGPGARRTSRAARITGRAPQPAAKAGAPAAATPAMTTTAAGPEGPLAGQPQVVVLEMINALLVNATPEQHVRIAVVIGYVDSEQEVRDIPYRVYPLENQDPEELATVLNQLIQETTTKEEKDAKIITTTPRTEEEIIIIPDPKTYSLIVYASKRNQQWIGALVRQLDEYRPQVLLDVTLVEVSKNEEFTLDLDLVTKFPRLEPGGTMDNPFFGELLSPFPAGRIVEMTAVGGGEAQAFYADDHIQALLTMMHKKGYGRVLARPKLLVNDNEAGTIKTEENVPIVSVETKVIPGTGVSSSTAAPSIKIDTYSAGVTLDIEPHISTGDQLRLNITLTRVDFRLNEDYSLSTPDGAVTGPTPPDLLTSDVTTVVTVPDGKTIILGGLERLNQNKGGTKVPILGDIPLIGGLFRSTANLDSQSRLYVFVKAHVLRPGETVEGESSIEYVSAKNRAAFEKYEKEMQEYEDWPGIKPTPMDPVRILEADSR